MIRYKKCHSFILNVTILKIIPTKIMSEKNLLISKSITLIIQNDFIHPGIKKYKAKPLNNIMIKLAYCIGW